MTTPKSFRDKFGEAFRKQFPKSVEPNLMEQHVAEWAARWMANKCAELAMLLTDEDDKDLDSAKTARSFITAELIRQLAKELE